MFRKIAGTVFVLGWGTGLAWSQTTLDALEQSLRDLERQHEQGQQAARESFARSLDAAVASPEAALQAWTDAGGRVPEAPKLAPDNEDWMESALEACQAQGVACPELAGALAGESQARKRLAKRAGDFQEVLKAYTRETAELAAWRHCQLVRFAADFSSKKTEPAKDPRWTAWLSENVAGFGRIFDHPIAGVSAGASPLVRQFEQEQLVAKEFKELNVKFMPVLYSTWILEPARASRSREIGKYWDAYILLNAAEAIRPERWEKEKLPWLQFQKQADECRVDPGVMPLTRLVEIMKQNPEHPRFKEMQAVSAELLADLKRRKSG